MTIPIFVIVVVYIYHYSIFKIKNFYVFRQSTQYFSHYSEGNSIVDAAVNLVGTVVEGLECQNQPQCVS